MEMETTQPKRDDERRLIYGSRAYLMVLPISWVRRHNLKRGDLMRVITQGDGSLRIIPSAHRYYQPIDAIIEETANAQ